MWRLHVAHSQQKPSEELVYSLARSAVESGDWSSLTTVSPTHKSSVITGTNPPLKSRPLFTIWEYRVQLPVVWTVRFKCDNLQSWNKRRTVWLPTKPHWSAQHHPHAQTHSTNYATYDTRLRYLCFSSCELKLPGLYTLHLQVRPV